MNPDRLKNIGLGILFLLVQVALFRHLKILKIQPDLVLIFLLWYAARYDRTSAIVMAAGFSFLQDALLDLWGLNMFTKTLLIFVSFNFIPRNTKKQLLIGQVFLTVLIGALVHNIIFLGLNSVIVNYTAEIFFWRHLIGNSCYTALVAAIIYLFRTR
ncbi:rod shape-determining protein MreD [Fodinibius halophilus]|uniref:Rod shape-determining protein MreD n=1 Tax=Fodinibius halophilus TaxID=1736908 RepID=A0A6M1TEX7_9BACT|nr:rod shape-determining protein MreD [Fodinibius halophilus]NGP89314.1 rod shape-determining protein MreD [Fodinibius halophilus]